MEIPDTTADRKTNKGTLNKGPDACMPWAGHTGELSTAAKAAPSKE
jgi:hypothetical protein